ncbi:MULTISPECIES: GNAT family N-acetyltransferase [unclassified Bradyrhizobium]|uniref:GNAT family N-acetyltransferase n=1 Tax=unclassified Bradyrhizobium TaxID=2631580 RepID=UPI00247A24FE|nr:MULTISPECIES: GNAT family N-acetyltransferase [unclassified Bradyrhizobium]WGR71139.1 GNAT family N-acetyltransferase [Bradyrhizobium sp. ISRA426]WGR75975.1 GNAT family N-acetyltransferase [Bradyrhizobium sp. ISRA430]WGR86379.1 GNAT family N-acetyltransferase [Bradyrhizobium sp. ISRA432]
MSIVWTDDLTAIDWDELSVLYRIAPLGNKAPADLALVFGNSMFRAFVYDSGRLVGAGRVLADGRDCAYLCDIAVHPDCQGQGLGRQIIERLLARCGSHRKIILYAVPGKEAFYERLGFRRMTTAMAIFEDQTHAYERGYLTAP